MEVFKFGGLSTIDAASVKRVVFIIRNNLHKAPVLVFSAMGKTTRLLEKLASATFQNLPSSHDFFNEFVEYHQQITTELDITDTSVYDELYDELKKTCETASRESYDFFYDQVVAYGELLASRIMSAYLTESGIANRWIDIRDYIKARPPYREAIVDMETTCSHLHSLFKDHDKDILTVTQGFLSGAADGSTITLGLDSSDYTAAIIANCIEASCVTIWKDVDGVLNADPRYFSDTVVLPELSYIEAVEQSFYGAMVIHPRTIKPLRNLEIPLIVRSFLYTEAGGTVIKGQTQTGERPVVYILKQKQLMITFIPHDFSFVMEDKISEIFNALCFLHIRANLMQNSAISFTVCIDHTPVTAELLGYLGGNFSLEISEGVELLTLRNYNEVAVNNILCNRKVLLKMLTNDVAQFIVQSEEK